MFQICVPNQKIQRKVTVIFLRLFKNIMTRNIKIKLFLILLEFQNLWNLISVLIKKIMKKIFIYFLSFLKAQ
jgi:hypothetical protein